MLDWVLEILDWIGDYSIRGKRIEMKKYPKINPTQTMNISTYKKQFTIGSFQESWLFGIDIFYFEIRIFSYFYFSLFLNQKPTSLLQLEMRESKEQIIANLKTKSLHSQKYIIPNYKLVRDSGSLLWNGHIPLSLTAPRLLMSLTSHNPLTSRMRVRS